MHLRNVLREKEITYQTCASHCQVSCRGEVVVFELVVRCQANGWAYSLERQRVEEAVSESSALY